MDNDNNRQGNEGRRVHALRLTDELVVQVCDQRERVVGTLPMAVLEVVLKAIGSKGVVAQELRWARKVSVWPGSKLESALENIVE